MMYWRVSLLCMMLAWLSTTRALAQDTRLGNTRAEAGSSEVFMRERNVAKHWGLRFRAAPTRNAFAEARLKERRKIAEEMKKPQYADKMYFGHKRPPKKRPLHKRKFCKECGIVH